mgnify:CR=1 FL=1
MIRLFETHHVRDTEELSGKLWDFTPMEVGYEDQVQKVMYRDALRISRDLGTIVGMLLMRPSLRRRERSALN